ncbi:methyl-accepting chemotaxis protein [Oceanicola sp. D3]|uniref:methyl-accepting chemotaxis protein n=1 Tax=Oceanicola sp. D3 TaxID=2587163 RepID=UPI001AEF3DFD|nr:methyl-accepting chemotaxis protein [Oceanicola sp. D3]
MKLRTKLPLLIFLIVAVTVAGFLGLLAMEGWKNAERSAYARLDAALEKDRAALQGWVDTIRSDLVVNSTEATVTSALQKLTGAFAAIEDPASDLQRLYIEENPHPVGEKHLYDFARDGSGYSIAHRRYHGFFRALQQVRGYYDVFLMDADGNVIYSVFKELDFATNVVEGPWAESGLGEVYRGAVSQAGAEERVFFVDYAPYGPSNGAPAGFAGIAITREDGTLQGVLAVQMPTDQVASLISQSAGIQEIFAGSDMKQRNTAGLAAIEPLDDEAVRRALQGEVGRLTGPIHTGETGLAAYGPVDFGSFIWAVSAQMTDEAAFGGINRLLTKAAIGGTILLLLATAVGFALSRGIVGPVTAVRNGLQGLTRGEYSHAVSGSARGDELGEMARSAETLRDKLQGAQAAEQDNIFRGAGFQASSAPMLMLDSDLRVSYANAAVEAFFDKHADTFAAGGLYSGTGELTGQGIDQLMPNPDSLQRSLDTPEDLPRTLFFRLDDTRFSMRVGAVVDDQGAPIGTVVELANATQEFMDRALMTSINRFLATIKMDRKAKVFEVNGTMAEVLGCAPEDLLGKGAPELFQFDPQSDAKTGTVLERLEQGENVFGLFSLRGPNGELRWLQGGFSPVRDTDGQVAMFLFMGSDVTEDREKLAEAEREQSRVAEAQTQVVDSLRVGLMALAEGNLTKLLDEQFSEGYDELRINFNEAASKLREAIAMVTENAGAIHREVGEIATSADDLSRRTERQATTLEETAAALDELTSSVRSAAQGADRANQMVTEARGNAEQGGKVVSEAVAAMGQISSSSDQISKIITVIEDIAFQTNLLALNAGVEAARAGEAGRGFAVVASEVRALAQRSSDAAREISGLISSSGDHVKRGVDLVGQTGEALREIVTSVTDIAGHVSEIAKSAKEQSSGLDEINTAMNQLDQVTQQNAAMFEQTNAASQSLSGEADLLKQTVSRFEIGKVADITEEREATVTPAPAAAAQPLAAKEPAGDKMEADDAEATAQPSSPAEKPDQTAHTSDTATPPVAPTPTFRSGRPSVPRSDGSAALAIPPDDEDWEEF